MTSAQPRLSRVIAAAALAALASTSAAASGNMFLKLHDVAGEGRDAASGHGEQIEIHSIQWRNAPPAGSTFKGEIAGIEPAYRSSGASKARGGTNTVDANEKITIHGARTEATETTGGRASSDMAMKGSKIGQNSTAGGDVDRPIVIGRLPNSPQAGQVAPMQYNPKELTIKKTNDWGSAARATPAAKGSVWIRMATPWAGCRVGKRYPSLELGEGGKTYMLQDVTVASCGRSGDADDRPTEEVAFYYNRIAFNYAR